MPEVVMKRLRVPSVDALVVAMGAIKGLTPPCPRSPLVVVDMGVKEWESWLLVLYITICCFLLYSYLLEILSLEMQCFNISTFVFLNLLAFSKRFLSAHV